MKVIFSTNFRPKTKNIVRAVFEKNIEVSDFGLIWRLFREYLHKSRIFNKNPAVWLFYLYSPLTSCKKSEKSLEPFLKKLHYQPTNQPIITNNTNFKGTGWCWSNKPFQKCPVSCHYNQTENELSQENAPASWLTSFLIIQVLWYEDNANQLPLISCYVPF